MEKHHSCANHTRFAILIDWWRSTCYLPTFWLLKVEGASSMSRRGKSAIQELEDAIKDQEFDLQAKGREIRGLSEQARLAQVDINMKEEVRSDIKVTLSAPSSTWHCRCHHWCIDPVPSLARVHVCNSFWPCLSNPYPAPFTLHVANNPYDGAPACLL